MKNLQKVLLGLTALIVASTLTSCCIKRIPCPKCNAEGEYVTIKTNSDGQLYRATVICDYCAGSGIDNYAKITQGLGALRPLCP